MYHMKLVWSEESWQQDSMYTNENTANPTPRLKFPQLLGDVSKGTTCLKSNSNCTRLIIATIHLTGTNKNDDFH